MKKVFLIFLFFPALALSSLEGTWEGNTGTLKNSKGWVGECKKSWVDIRGEIGTYRVKIDIECSGVAYRQSFDNIRNSGSSDILIETGYRTLHLYKSGSALYIDGEWRNINWPGEEDPVNAWLKVTLQR